MHRAKIFLVGNTADDLIPMEERDYVAEAHLQRLLADYPDLLPGDQITPDDPRRWLLVAREMGVPGNVTETGRWYLDHLFLDQDGVPTFVECKRSSDTRARREVVAQMLDYAANGTEYWSPDRLRQAAAETAQTRGRDLDAEILVLLGAEPEDEAADIEAYWQVVEENLREGRVRLLFVADQTSRELRRLVEFLNTKMADVEVLAVEIKQYLSEDGRRAVVPRAIGVQARQSVPKRVSKARVNRAVFLDHCAPDVVPFFERVLNRAAEEGHEIYWGTSGFSVRAQLAQSGGKSSFVYGYPKRSFQCFFGDMKTVPEQEREAVRAKLEAMDIFTPGGDYTLRMKIDTDTYDAAMDAYELMLREMAELRERY